MRKYQKSKSGPKSKQDKSRPAPEGPFRKEGTEKEVARIVMPRRWKALPAAGAVAALIAERDERDHELAEQITRSFEWRRRSKAHVENDLGGVRSEKRVRVTESAAPASRQYRSTAITSPDWRFEPAAIVRAIP